MRRSESVVLIERFQYELLDPRGGDLEIGPGDGFGLLVLRPSRPVDDFLTVQTGSPWGALGLSVELHETAPGPVVDPWVEVVEVSIRPPWRASSPMRSDNAPGRVPPEVHRQQGDLSPAMLAKYDSLFP